jgi:phage shock protein PspC (stress-responsive transcriptional regulator)
MEVTLMTETRLTRSDTDRMIAGVCGGIAAYIGMDPVLVRLAFILLAPAGGIGLPIYFILWVIMPRAEDLGKPNANVLQDNLEEMGHKVSSGVSQIGRPGTIGMVLILFGIYFLLNQFGWGGGIFWPVVIIGLGLFLLARRSNS